MIDGIVMGDEASGGATARVAIEVAAMVVDPGVHKVTGDSVGPVASDVMFADPVEDHQGAALIADQPLVLPALLVLLRAVPRIEMTDSDDLDADRAAADRGLPRQARAQVRRARRRASTVIRGDKDNRGGEPEERRAIADRAAAGAVLVVAARGSRGRDAVAVGMNRPCWKGRSLRR